MVLNPRNFKKVSLPLLWVRSSVCDSLVVGFPGGSECKASATMRKTQVQSLGQEDPLKKEMATHSSTLGWKMPWTEELGKLQSMGLQRVGHD